MNNYHNQPPQLGGNLKFNVYPGIDLTADVAKLSPKLIIAISLGLLAIGLCRYYQTAQPEKENKS